MGPVDRRGSSRRLLAVRRLAVPVLVATGTLTLVAVVAAVARRDPVRGTVLGLVLSGAVTLISGVTVVTASAARHRRGDRGERPRALLGLAVTVWGVGQLVLGLDVTAAGRRTFGVGDAVSTLAVPLLVLALIGIPRRSRVLRPALWLVLNALVLMTTLTLVVWWWLLQPALPDPMHPGGDGVSSVVLAAFDTGTAAMTALVWARDRRRGAAAVVAGLVLHAVADISSLPAVIGERPLPWAAGAIWCLAAPLLSAGIIAYRPAPAGSPGTVPEDLGESLATTVSAVVSLTVLAVALGVPVRDRWTPIGLGLGVAAVALLLVRETLNSAVRGRMVRWLGSEALHDVLTGLPNRSALTERMRRLDLRTPWVLLTVDLDHFKEVNDLVGAEAGDDLIVLIADVLRQESPADGLVARMGGDEFAVLAKGTVEDGERLARRLLVAVRRAVRDLSGGVVLSASIGVGRVLPEDGGAPARDVDVAAPGGGGGGAGEGAAPADERRDRLTALLESAAALRAAKDSGRDRIVLYPGTVEQARRRRLLLERRLRAAVETGLLEMHAQPLVDLRTGRTAGFESLARWTDDVLGPVSPVEFVPVAEQSGLVAALGELALGRTLVEARAAGIIGRDVEVGVNVSPIQLRHLTFAPMVIDMVTAFGLEPRQLLLEVTEAILVDEDDPASAALALLADAGIRLAIDDFGTGYSALGYLRRLPVDVIKIDRSWVRASVTDGRTRDIVGGVVSLAHTLGASVVMEGIEDEASAQLCRDLDADLGQGWLFGRPEPWPQAVARLDGGSFDDGPYPRRPEGEHAGSGTA